MLDDLKKSALEYHRSRLPANWKLPPQNINYTTRFIACLFSGVAAAAKKLSLIQLKQET